VKEEGRGCFCVREKDISCSVSVFRPFRLASEKTKIGWRTAFSSSCSKAVGWWSIDGLMVGHRK